MENGKSMGNSRHSPRPDNYTIDVKKPITQEDIAHWRYWADSFSESNACACITLHYLIDEIERMMNETSN